MSADLDPAENGEELPQEGVRNRSQFAVDIHRQYPRTDVPLPACGEQGRDARFKTCHPPSLIGFDRWSLCDNVECFGDRGRDSETDGSAVATDGGSR